MFNRGKNTEKSDIKRFCNRKNQKIKEDLAIAAQIVSLLRVICRFSSERRNATSHVLNFCRDFFVVTPRCYYGNSMVLLW